MIKFVYVLTVTYDTEEKNYETGSYIDSVYRLKSSANKAIKELKKEQELDDCVSVSYEINRMKVI